MLNELIAEIMTDPELVPQPPLRPMVGPDGKIGGYYEFLAKLVRRIQPKRIVELGTGAGFSAAFMMGTLPAGATLTTINHPYPISGDQPGSALGHWDGDPRLVRLLGDTLSMGVLLGACSGLPSIDLLFIDSDHTHVCASAEWALYEPALADNAIVCFDDIRMNDMGRFWDWLPCDKVALDISPFGFGVVQYARGK